MVKLWLTNTLHTINKRYRIYSRRSHESSQELSNQNAKMIPIHRLTIRKMASLAHGGFWMRLQTTLSLPEVKSFGRQEFLGSLVNLEFAPTLSCSSFANRTILRKYLKMAGKYTIVMVRHGESEWNQKNLFCGWFDANLSDKGKEEAVAAGKAVKDAGLKFDVAHTSVLTRAQVTLNAILEQSGQTSIPIEKTWRLNERHYGGLTGLNKAETAAKYGEEQVQIWRRSFDVPPPPMEPNHPYYDTIVKDARYANDPKPEEFPMFESLKLTIERTLPYWNNTIIPQMKAGKRIIIAAHGNSLRGIVKHLDNMSDDAIMALNLPTGIPFVYELDENFKPVVSMKFLGDEETVRKAMEAVAAQGKAK